MSLPRIYVETSVISYLLATLSRSDFIATWNFAHLVGPVAKFRLQTAIQNMGFPPPILATPEELLETLS